MNARVACCLAGVLGLWSADAHELTSEPLLWQAQTGSPVTSPAVVGLKGQVYITSGYTNLHAFDRKGRERWRFTANYVSPPTVAADGTIYVTTTCVPDAGPEGCSRVIALAPDGRMLWATPTEGGFTSVALADDGTLYLGSLDGTLFAIGSAGERKWTVTGGNWIQYQPAIGRDGTLYLPDYPYLKAFSPEGDALWTTGGPSVIPSPIILGDDGGIYIGIGTDYGLMALGPEGTFRWVFPLREHGQFTEVIGPDGTIYFSSGATKFYALTAAGTPKWQRTSYDLSPGEPGTVGMAAVAADGTIYLPVGNKLTALNPDGTVQWQFSAIGRGPLTWPIIGPNGIVYFGDGDDNVYALRGSAGPASNGWPMFRHDPQGTNNAGHRSARHRDSNDD